MLQLLVELGHYDVRELLYQRESVEATHLADVRPGIAEIAANLEIDESTCSPAPRSIALFDDVVTTGKHFRAAKQVLEDRFPGVPIYGIFVARRVFAPGDEGQ
jgi:predicted amidophosphoribosyltransferase